MNFVLSVFLNALFALLSMPGPESGVQNDHALTKIPGTRSAPLILINNRIYTKVSLDGGKAKRFLVDNGWSQTSVASRCVDEDSFFPEKDVKLHALNKRFITEVRGRIRSIKVGEIEMDDPYIRLSEIMARLSRKIGLKVHGVFACEPMHGYLTTFDFQGRKMLFTRMSDRALEIVKAQEGVVSLPFGRHPSWKTSPQIISVKIAINGTPVDAIIDLGFPGGILTTLNPGELGVDEGRHLDEPEFKVVIAGYSGTGRKSTARSVSIGGHKRENVPFICLDSENAPTFAMFGVEFVKNYTMTLDFHNRMLYLAPND